MTARWKTVRSASLASAVFFTPIAAYAQAADVTPETVIVTGSLITRPGFDTPTPVTSVTADDLSKAATTNLVDLLQTMPQFGAGVTNQTGYQGGNYAGATYANLRNLGTNRTLVLLDGDRIVPTALTNIIDFNMLPTTLLQRVDVVTGGASSTYGSDAVAGVVNLILDKNFDGFKASAQYGNNTQNAYEGYKAEAAAGADFDGDRGHIEASFSYFDNPQIYEAKQANWNLSSAYVLNPAYTATNGQPQLTLANFIGLYKESTGGVITSGPLANTIFVGKNAVPSLYIPGDISGVISSGGNASSQDTDDDGLALAQHGMNAFIYTRYRITPDITAHLEFDYGQDGGTSAVLPYQSSGNITILSGNPFIPATTQAEMTALGVTSFQMGSNNINLMNPEYNESLFIGRRDLTQGTIGLDGVFAGWAWKADYSHGETHGIELWEGDAYAAYYNNAIDAVVAPAGNTAGIAPGTIVCRSTLTNPTNGCQPLDLFGVGNASQAALNYVQPVPWTRINNALDAASVSAQGNPIDDWAGPISVAVGAAYRRQSLVGTSDPLTLTYGFDYGNNAPIDGAITVYEGYGEVIVPLAKDEWWSKDLDFDGAGRITDYSTSGLVETWKLGLTDQVIDDVRLRATWSSDIRAPNISELFAQGVTNGTAIADPFNPGQAPNTLQTVEGNPNLKPEDADTISGGVVLTPTFLPGFQASFDFYSVDIKGAISTLSAQNEINYCFAGQQQYCPLILRTSSGTLHQILEFPENNAYARTSGLDMEVSYTHPLWDGNINLHMIGNYMDENTSVNASNVTTDNAGSISPGSGIGGSGFPKFRGTISATYNADRWSGTVQTRLISSGVLLNTWTSAIVANNNVPWVGYLDLRGSYSIDDHWQAFFAIDNVLDTPPPDAPGAYNSGSVYYTPEAPGTVYDLLGRQYRVGMRVRF